MLKIRLQRTGRKNQPFYSVVVAEHSSAAKGKFIEKLGFYNPLTDPWTFEVKTDRILEWIKKGAKPSNTVARLLKKEGVKDMEKFITEMPDKKKKKEVEVKEDPSSAKATEDKTTEAPEEKTEEPKEEEKKEESIDSAQDDKEEEKTDEPIKEEGEDEASPVQGQTIEPAEEKEEEAPAEPFSDESTEASEEKKED